ncbi:hypothetical protein HJG60_011305 [Phyllostomus discolor]|uniref:Uncharacterized protein n=1 Tax=Phyllostomus discolor TaxID=89673 RepID=A0A834A2K2_9CHIR|nr:hypothetical protein HJG60_011305 [Phyllostomus discolor]
MCIAIHSPGLPGYINVTQTILVILTMAGLFPDRPHIWNLMSLLMEITRKKKDLDKENRGKVAEGGSGERWRGPSLPHLQGLAIHGWPTGQMGGHQYEDSEQVLMCSGQCMWFMGTETTSAIVTLLSPVPSSAQFGTCRHGTCVCLGTRVSMARVKITQPSTAWAVFEKYIPQQCHLGKIWVPREFFNLHQQSNLLPQKAQWNLEGGNQWLQVKPSNSLR